MMTDELKKQIEDYILEKSDIKPEIPKEDSKEAQSYIKFVVNKQLLKVISKVCMNVR